MDEYQQSLAEEQAYLKEVLAFIRSELAARQELLAGKKSDLAEARKEMWEDAVHYTSDFEKLVDMMPQLNDVSVRTVDVDQNRKFVEGLRRLLDSPYFGRIDFKEAGFDREQIYIGLRTLNDNRTHRILVYDWRAPVSSMFYRHEPGPATYESPAGEVSGEILLKRQYKITNSKLEYFFDCSLAINDEMLQEVLGHNASLRMRNIVETIQQEQDLIIRDTSHDLVIVQGVAGSGKTSIALHRIAYLLYQGLGTGLDPKNFIIVSPNTVFSNYISSVLPELGEENVAEVTFDDLLRKHLGGRLNVENRNRQLEALFASPGRNRQALRQRSVVFKGSRTFAQILQRLVKHFEQHMIPFADVYFAGTLLETRDQLKNQFLNELQKLPPARRLRRLENRLLDKVHPLQKKYQEQLEEIVRKRGGHEFEEAAYSRILSARLTKSFEARLKRFTEVDYLQLYRHLFTQPGPLTHLAQGLDLPEGLDDIARATRENLDRGWANYEDGAALLYLRLLLEGTDQFREIRQVVVDEAQDYYPLQYEIFRLLFPRTARYTVLGDMNQAMERRVDVSIYDTIADILAKPATKRLFLNKSYRSSFELNQFTQSLLGNRQQDFVSLERHEAGPALIQKDTREALDQAIAQDIAGYFAQGYGSVAVICKTRAEAERTHARLSRLTTLRLIRGDEEEISRGAMVIPSYMAKGLEFDVVLVPDASRENYATDLDRKLLYVTCTRALHRLGLYYTGEKSEFL